MPGNVTSPGVSVQTSGAPLLASNALPIGTRINEFEITRVIGEGGFSVVYLAFDHTLHRSIALKEYIPSALASRRGDQTVAVRSAQHQQTFEAGLRSFINESRLLAQFDHPALVKVYRFWEANGTAYMAMPHYQGRTLKEILREHPEQASEAWLKRLLVPLLDALALLHLHHCYHRDIAPDNIQILENGEPVLLDFGAARRTIGDMTQAFTVILKPGYAPIEQYAEETDLKQGPWTDVYALSAVLHGAIVGKPPPTSVARVIKDPLEPLAARGIAGFDPPFLAGIDRGLAVRPEARPQSIAEWRSLLGIDAPGAAREAASVPLETRTARTSHDDRMPTAPRIDAADDVAADEDTEDEADRTVLVPGLRRSPPATRSETPKPASTVITTAQRAVSPSPARDAHPPRDEAARTKPWIHIALVAGIVIVAVVAIDRRAAHAVSRNAADAVNRNAADAIECDGADASVVSTGIDTGAAGDERFGTAAESGHRNRAAAEAQASGNPRGRAALGSAPRHRRHRRVARIPSPLPAVAPCAGRSGSHCASDAAIARERARNGVGAEA